MIKKIILLFLLSFTFTYSEVADEINLFKAKELNLLNERINEIKKKYEIEFKVYVFDKAENEQNYLNKQAKSVIINLLKEKKKKAKISLKFSEDIQIVDYKEEMELLLENLGEFVEKEYYFEFLYELIGNTGDIFSIIEKKQENRKKEKSDRKLSFFITIFFVTTFIIVIYIYYKNLQKTKERTCKNCNIDMELDEIKTRHDKIIKVYTCKVCGYSKKTFTNRH